MKNVFYTLLTMIFLLLMQGLSAQKVTYSDPWSNAGFTLQASTDKSASINFSIHDLNLEDIPVDGQVMKNIGLPGSFLFNDEGCPNLPGNGRYIAIPQGATATLHILSSRVETMQNIDIIPAPRIPKEDEAGEMEYHKNMQVYSNNAFYPAQPVTLSAPTQIRGVDVVMLGITPFQYNPVTKELKIYRDLKIEISFQGGNGHFGEDRLRSRFWDPILEDALFNASVLPKIDYDARAQEVTDVPGYEYLIITPTGAPFVQWADSIRRFRIQQGISTVVKTLTEVGGNTTTAIESYIDNAYHTWNPAPSAILLLGDYGADATCSVISPIWDSYCVSDNMFGDVTGDSLPDICMARITANDASQLQVMVTKFLNYERNPPTSAYFYSHPITALGWQTERWFQICSEVTGGFWKNVQLKTPVRINEVYSGTPGSVWSTATNTSTVINYFGPAGQNYIPATPAEMPCCWTGGNGTQINAAINAGAFCLMHRDHGGETGWGEPAYGNSNINGLTNVNQLSFIFSINCLTGKYNYGSECFAEKFHRYTYNGQNAGALGLIAASEVSYSFVNDTYLWGMMDNFWPNFMPTYGTNPASRGFLPCFGNVAGKYFLQQSSWPYNTSNKMVTYHLFHHHGDAFSVVYSEVPQTLTVSHNPNIQAGTTSFQVTANTGSFIALTLNDQILGTATGTGSPVTITIPNTLVVGQTMHVTITLQNYFRYNANVPVIPNGGPAPDFMADSTAICNGNNVDFTDLTTGNPTSWLWSFPGGTPASSTDQHPQNIVYTNAGSYSVTLTATNSVCPNTITKTAYITVSGPTSTPSAPEGNAELCMNSTNTLYTVVPVPQAVTYNWVLTPDTAGVVTPSDSNTCVVNWSDTYVGYAYLKVQAANGCGISGYSPELTIHIQPFPVVPNQPSGPASLCFGMQTTSDYSTSPVENALNYTWSLQPSTAGTITWLDTACTVTWDASFMETATLKVKAGNNCSESLYSEPLEITVNENPVVDLGEDITIPQLQTTTLDAGNPGASYLWSNNATTQTITVGYQGNEADTYFVDVTSNGCVGSDTITVNYYDPTGIPEYNGKLNVIVTPNPSNGKFKLDVASSVDHRFDLRIMNVLGEFVYQLPDISLQGKYSAVIDLSVLRDGVYYLLISTPTDKVTRKLVIQK